LMGKTLISAFKMDTPSKKMGGIKCLLCGNIKALQN
jgi:hypothetical protein